MPQTVTLQLQDEMFQRCQHGAMAALICRTLESIAWLRSIQ
jgi:hypothetical protein